ncbi:SURF1 family-domain-containing protein [Myxozyma melibiosi]|uniref:SURF1-like protein n=1 Tax=Myxozyma melibiosi TaxID=54550 RepID=A0ABR1FCF2_9ASCO
MPIISFGLAAWQVYRLEWKTNLIAEYENRLLLPPLVLPPKLDSEAINKLQYRRVLTKGKFRYDQEFQVGPRLYEGENGYAVITPFEREDGSTILINRGWIRKDMADQSKRSKAAMPEGPVFVEGLIKSPAKPNYFTPKNVPEKNEFYFVDVEEFARMTNAEPVIIEELVTQYLDSDAFVSWETLSDQGIPIGRLPKHDLRNTHSQYIATWAGVFLATSVMCVMMLRSPKTSKARKVQHARKYYS